MSSAHRARMYAPRCGEVLNAQHMRALERLPIIGDHLPRGAWAAAVQLRLDPVEHVGEVLAVKARMRPLAHHRAGRLYSFVRLVRREPYEVRARAKLGFEYRFPRAFADVQEPGQFLGTTRSSPCISSAYRRNACAPFSSHVVARIDPASLRARVCCGRGPYPVADQERGGAAHERAQRDGLRVANTCSHLFGTRGGLDCEPPTPSATGCEYATWRQARARFAWLARLEREEEVARLKCGAEGSPPFSRPATTDQHVSILSSSAGAPGRPPVRRRSHRQRSCARRHTSAAIARRGPRASRRPTADSTRLITSRPRSM